MTKFANIFAALIAIMLSSQVSAQSDSSRAICKRTAQSNITVLVGRISVVLGSPDDRGDMFERIGANTIAASLYQSDGIDVTVWNSDGSNARNFPAADLLISSVFINGTTLGQIRADENSETAQTQSRRVNELARLLADAKCDILIGAHVIIDSSFITIHPYVLSSIAPEVRQPFGPIVVKANVRLTRLADQIADLFQKFILEDSSSKVQYGPVTSISFICLPQSVLSDREKKLLMQYNRIVSQTAFILKASDLNSINIEPYQSGCTTAVRARNSITVEPIIGLETAKEQISIKISFPSSSEGDNEDATPLVMLFSSGDWKGDQELAGQKTASNLSEFFKSIYRQSVGFPRIGRDTVRKARENPEPYLMMGVGDAHLEEAILSLRLATGNSDELSVMRAAVISKLLLLKGLPEAALTLINQASGKLNAASKRELAKYFEVRAQISKENGSLEDSEQSLERSKAEYTDLNDAPSIRRIDLAQADLSYQKGNPEEALQHLLVAARLNPDGDIYRKIGELLLSKGDPSSAAYWLILASDAKPDNIEIKNIIAQLSSLDGEAKYDSGNYNDAYELFGRAFKYVPTEKYSYQAGLAATRLGKNAEAIERFQRVISQQRGPDAVKWVEASWLLLMQTYLVDENYVELEVAAGDMRKADFSAFTEANVVSAYLLMLAHIVRDERNAEDYMQSDAFRQLKSARNISTSQNLRWDNTVISDWLSKKRLTPNQLLAVASARRAAGLVGDDVPSP